MSTVSIRAGIPELGKTCGQVIVDGHDLSKAVRGASIRVEVGARPEVVLDLCVFELDQLELEDAEVIIVSCLAYGWVYCRNFLAWHREARALAGGTPG